MFEETPIKAVIGKLDANQAEGHWPGSLRS